VYPPNTGANDHIADLLYRCPNNTILAHGIGHTKHSMTTAVVTGADKRLASMSGQRYVGRAPAAAAIAGQRMIEPKGSCGGIGSRVANGAMPRTI
jgi:hypothetical protein